jgi:FAD/FMN-containing dehydrogenase
LQAIEDNLGSGLVPRGTTAALIVEVDGTPRGVQDDLELVVEACRSVGAKEISRARDDAERDTIWSLRRQTSAALKATGLVKINHDVVVPKGRVPELFDVIAEMKRAYGLRVASFGHAGDGNIHVNLLITPGDADEAARAKEAERFLFTRVVALEGSISGEHGIGFAKAPYLSIELSADEIALMKRLKTAFDPNGILNPGKIFP